MWFRWFTFDAFNGWHDAVCATLGIPHPGRNAATGEIDEDAQWTTAYVEPVIVNENDIRAFLPAFHAEALASGAVPCEPPPEPEPK